MIFELFVMIGIDQSATAHYFDHTSAQEQFLYPPIQRLGDVQLALRGAPERMRTRELSEVASRATDHS